MQLTKTFLLAAIPDAVVLYGDLSEAKEFYISVDSRNISGTELFLALDGEKVDGHTFVEDALSNGTAGLIIEHGKETCLKKIHKNVLNEKVVISVPNSLHALVALAKEHRKKFDIPISALTGSIGKTTAKEMVRSILNTLEISTFVSMGNQNSLIGLSLNILRLRPTHKLAVFELGINSKGEMEELVDLLKPTVGVITWICESHTLGLGSLEEIAKEKLLIFSKFGLQNASIIPGDLQILKRFDFNYPIIRFGEGEDNQVRATNIKCDSLGYSFSLTVYDTKFKVRLQCEAPSFVNNALAAAALSSILGISEEQVVRGLESFVPIDGRFKRKEMKDNLGYLIDDCYNANPESMKAALIAFDQLEGGGTKIAVLGDMLELGDQSEFWHRNIGEQLLRTTSIDKVLLVGEHAKYIAIEAGNIPVQFAKDWREAQDILSNVLGENNFVLLKSSKGVGLKNLVSLLC